MSEINLDTMAHNLDVLNDMLGMSDIDRLLEQKVNRIIHGDDLLNNGFLNYYRTLEGEIALTTDNQLMIKKDSCSWSSYDFNKNKKDHLDTFAHLMRKSWVKGDLMLCLLKIHKEHSEYYEIKSICKSMVKELSK